MGIKPGRGVCFTMNVGWDIETYASVGTLILSIALTIPFFRLDWKKYGLLFLLSAVVGMALCFIFIGMDLYSFPHRLFPGISKIPFTAILTIFPLYVLVGVRYSPRPWAWKIPFYWVMVHLGMAAEFWAEEKTQLIKYGPAWDLWDSYTWWWIFLLVFEWIGGMIVPEKVKKPLEVESFKFGKLGWFIHHFILMTTIFLAGYIAGRMK